MIDEESERPFMNATEPGAPSPSAVTTRIVPGVVDVVVLRLTEPVQSGQPAQWETLTLRRGPNTRCTGAWEIVHGRIEKGERPERAAIRELSEETGLIAERLYNVTINSFYLHQIGTIQMALVFAAVVGREASVTLANEHDAYEWRSFDAASETLAWPREREALTHVRQLLRFGDAGPVEDVLRII